MEEQHPTKETLLELYRQLMESQRDNTRIAYSWIGNVFLVLVATLIVFGLSTQERNAFIPAMVLGIGLSFIWAAVTEVFAAYTRQRFAQALEIEKELHINGLANAGAERFKKLGWRQYLVQARAYVWLFVALNVAVWLTIFFLRF